MPRLQREQLTDHQAQTLSLVRADDVHAAINDLLRERGIPLKVHYLQLVELDPANEAPPNAAVFADDPGPAPVPKGPIPGICYCCTDPIISAPG